MDLFDKYVSHDHKVVFANGTSITVHGVRSVATAANGEFRSYRC